MKRVLSCSEVGVGHVAQKQEEFRVLFGRSMSPSLTNFLRMERMSSSGSSVRYSSIGGLNLRVSAAKPAAAVWEIMMDLAD
jgi:hypothetical protein